MVEVYVVMSDPDDDRDGGIIGLYKTMEEAIKVVDHWSTDSDLSVTAYDAETGAYYVGTIGW